MFGIFVVRHEKYLYMFYLDTRCYATPEMKIQLHIMYYRRRYFFVSVFGNFSFLKSKTQILLEGFSQLGNQTPNFLILSLLCVAEDWRGNRQGWRGTVQDWWCKDRTGSALEMTSDVLQKTGGAYGGALQMTGVALQRNGATQEDWRWINWGQAVQ